MLTYFKICINGYIIYIYLYYIYNIIVIHIYIFTNLQIYIK